MATVEITAENFASEVENAQGKVLVDFWASWCGPCRMLSPIVDQVASEHTDVKVGKVNVDEQPKLAEKFQIMSIPTLLVFENGISVFGAGILLEYGLVVELGILLDVFVLVFVLGIAIHQINRTFSSLDTDKMNRLGDVHLMHQHH